MKTGEVFDRDEDGQLWLCESWLNEEHLCAEASTLVELADIQSEGPA